GHGQAAQGPAGRDRPLRQLHLPGQRAVPAGHRDLPAVQRRPCEPDRRARLAGPDHAAGAGRARDPAPGRARAADPWRLRAAGAPSRIDRFGGPKPPSARPTVVSSASVTTSLPGGRSTETTWPRSFSRESGIVTRGGRLRPLTRVQTVCRSLGSAAQPAGTWL